MPTIFELLLQQQEEQRNKPRNRIDTDSSLPGLMASLIQQTETAAANNRAEGKYAQSWMDSHYKDAADLGAQSMRSLAGIQALSPGYGQEAKKGVIGNLVGQVLNGIGQGAAQGAGNLVQGLIEGKEPKPNDNNLITNLLGQPTQQGTGEWHAPMLPNQTLPDTGTGLAGGKISPMTAGLAMMTGQDPNTRETGGNIVQQFLTPKEERQAKAPTMRTMGVPGMDGYRQNFYLDANNNPVAVGEPWKTSSGVTIQMGDQQNISPATPEQKQAYGLNPQAPAVYDKKTGEVKPINVPQGPKPTEDQQKTGMYLQGMTDSYHRVERALELYGDIGKPQFTDRIGVAIGSQAVPESVSGQFSKNVKSEKWQAIEQANAEFGNYALKTLTGAGQSEGEARENIKAMLPALGDAPNIQEAKRAARQTVIKAAGGRAGQAAQQSQQSPQQATQERPPQPGEIRIINGRKMKWVP